MHSHGGNVAFAQICFCPFSSPQLHIAYKKHPHVLLCSFWESVNEFFYGGAMFSTLKLTSKFAFSGDHVVL